MPLFRWLHFFELLRQWTTISLNSTERPGQEEQITLERREVGTSLQITRKCKNKYVAALLLYFPQDPSHSPAVRQTGYRHRAVQANCPLPHNSTNRLR